MREREREDRRAHESESVGRGAFSAFILSSSRLLLFLESTNPCTPAPFLSVLITNRFDRDFPPSPTLPSPPSLLSLKNIIVPYISLSLRETRFVIPRGTSCRLEITFNRGESRSFTRVASRSERERERESFRLVFDLIGRYKSGARVSLFLSLSVFIRADGGATLF